MCKGCLTPEQWDAYQDTIEELTMPKSEARKALSED